MGALREMLRIAGPTVATMTSYTVMQFVDKLMVSRIGPEPIYVGAQGNGGLAAFVPMSIAMGTLTVVNTYVSQNLGAGRPERGPAYAWNGLWMGVAYWVALLVPYGLMLPTIFRGMGHAEERVALESLYGQILIFGGVLNICTRGLSQFFYGMHRASVVMVAGVAANIVNLGLNYVLVFGKLGVPALGVAGSAIGTVAATALELSIPLCVFLGPGMNARYRTRSQWRLSGRTPRDLLRIGWPAGLMFGNEMVCWGYFMVSLVGRFGPEHSTAGWIAHQYMSLSFMPAVGISVATTALVGKYMGMRRPDLAGARAWLGLKLAVAYMGLCALLFIIFRRPMVELFIDAQTPPELVAQVVAIGSTFLVATAAFQAFDAVAMTISGALRGAGDTVVPGVATMVLSWTVIVGGGTAIVHWFPGLSSLGPWIAAAAYIALLSLMMLGRFLMGSWRARNLLGEAAGASAGTPEAVAALEAVPPPAPEPA